MENSIPVNPWVRILKENELWEKLKARQRSTGVLLILCPVHFEKTPSLHLWHSGNFLCHGCHWHGNMEKFLRMIRRFKKYNNVFPPSERPSSMFDVNVPFFLDDEM